VRAPGGVGRGAQVELGKRGAKVQAGAADDDRPAAGVDEAVDLRMGHGRVGAGGEAVRERHGADQAVLERVALALARSAGEDLEPRVDLQRVGGDRDRVLAARRAACARARSRPPSCPPRWGRRWR
jgi:hypothetical protein